MSDALDEIYATHPLREETILARVSRQRIVSALTEWHLAVDPETDITDQNHSGGVQSVIELGVTASIASNTVVIDLGAGLGGSARVLAAAFGCHVMAIDRDARRCHDARNLTARVGLQDLVSIVELDALAGSPSPSSCDVLWGQAAWMHFDDLESVLTRWTRAVRDGGRVAIADAYLKRAPANDLERQIVHELEAAWHGRLRPITDWLQALERCGFIASAVHDRTEDALASVRRTVRSAARWNEGTVTAAERESWSRAIRAFDNNLVGNMQIVAARVPL